MATQTWKRTFYAAWTAQMCSIMGFSFVLPFLPLYIQSDLGISDKGDAALWAGIVGASAAVTLAISSPIWGALADRFGRKPMVLRSMLGGAVVLVLMSQARTVGQLVALRLVQGCLTGTVSASVALVASVAPRERSGYALGMMQAAVFVGASVGPCFGGLVAQAYGLRAAFVAAGLLLLLGALVVHFAVREEFKRPSQASTKAERGTFAQVFAGAGFLAAVFTLFSIRFANSAARPVFALFVEEIRGGGERSYRLVGLIFSAGGFSAALSAWFLGRVSDTWGHKRLLIASCAVAGVISVAYVAVGQIWQLFVLRVLFGVAAAGMIPAANAIIRRTTQDRNLGKAYGVTNSMTAVGWATGQLAGGWLGKTMGLRAPFVLMGAVLGLAAGLVVWCIKSPAADRAR